MTGLFDIRLRRALHLKTREQRMMEMVSGRELPATVIPARTSLAVVDVFNEGLYCIAPSGRRVLVDPETCRESGYIPKATA